MFVVVSKWQYDPAHEAEVRDRARAMMAAFRSWPDVEFAYNVRTGPDSVLAVIGYKDRASWERIVEDPNGPFEKTVAEIGVDRHATWQWSERGEVEEP